MSAQRGGVSWCEITPTWCGVTVQFGHPDRYQFAEAVETLKDRVPAWARSYDAGTRTWTVEQDFEDLVRTWASHYFAQQRRPGPTGPTPAHGYREPGQWRAAGADGAYGHDGQDRQGYGYGAPPPPVVDPRTAAYRTLHLLPSAPPELVKSAWRCLVHLNHPDHGGDPAALREVIGAYKMLEALLPEETEAA